MINLKPEPRTPSASTNNAFSFISKGWNEVRHSADADLQLMRARANSFKNLATSFDRELENFINSASTFSAIKSSSAAQPPAEIDFVKKLQPKLSEFRRAYSSPDFSKKVLEKWSPRARIRIDLSAIRNAIVSEVDEEFDGRERPQYTSTNNVTPAVVERVLLPTQIVEKPAAVHEEIRKEVVEEIQPVINVEKMKTEVHQVTQPLFDKEVKAVSIEQRVLNTEVLPEVLVEGRGVRAAQDVSTIKMQATSAMVIEKPAIFNEVVKTQIIEEIQPVIYKETVVPSVIQETKPVYQKIVEGPVYTQQVLPPKSLAEFQSGHGAARPL